MRFGSGGKEGGGAWFGIRQRVLFRPRYPVAHSPQSKRVSLLELACLQVKSPIWSPSMASRPHMSAEAFFPCPFKSLCPLRFPSRTSERLQATAAAAGSGA
jgi:hypothetical protein